MHSSSILEYKRPPENRSQRTYSYRGRRPLKRHKSDILSVPGGQEADSGAEVSALRFGTALGEQQRSPQLAWRAQGGFPI